MKILNLLSIITLSFVAVACQQDLPDGKIPTEYIENAKQYEGQYKGEVQLIRYRMKKGGVSSSQILDEISDAQLTLSLDGDRPVVQSDFDFTMKSKCQSSVGNIKSVSASPVINDVATFKFNSGNCADEFNYNEITFWVGKGIGSSKQLLFEIVKYYHTTSSPQGYVKVIVKGRFKKI